MKSNSLFLSTLWIVTNNGQGRQGDPQQNHVEHKVNIKNRAHTRVSQGIQHEAPAQGDIREAGLRQQEQEGRSVHRRLLLARLPRPLQGVKDQRRVLAEEDSAEQREGRRGDGKTGVRWLDCSSDLGMRAEGDEING